MQEIVDGNPLQVLVATVFLLARFGLGFRVLQYGYVGADFPEPSGFSRHILPGHDAHDPWPGSALVVGRGWDHWWVAAGLAHYLLIIPAIVLSGEPALD